MLLRCGNRSGLYGFFLIGSTLCQNKLINNFISKNVNTDGHLVNLFNTNFFLSYLKITILKIASDNKNRTRCSTKLLTM